MTISTPLTFAKLPGSVAEMPKLRKSAQQAEDEHRVHHVVHRRLVHRDAEMHVRKFLKVRELLLVPRMNRVRIGVARRLLVRLSRPP